MTSAVGELRVIALKELVVHTANPRKVPGDLTEMVDSMREHGVITPLVGVRENGHIAVIDGSRRLSAARLAGLTEVPVYLRDPQAIDAQAQALIANLSRQDLSPLEEAEGYRSWLSLTGKTQKDLAAAVSRAPSTIANALRLLDAAPAIRKALEKGSITAAHAKVAMSLPEGALPMLELSKGMSVQELQDEAREVGRAFQGVERIRAAFEKAEKAGMTATWPTKKIYVDGIGVDPVKVFGQPKKSIAGDIDYPGSIGGGSVAQHDESCECRAVGLNHYSHGQVKRVCISPSGWRAYQAAARKSVARMSGRTKKRVVTAAMKAAKAEADLKKNVAEATKALAGKSMGYGQLDLGRASAFLSAASADEAQRLVLFGVISKHSLSARGNAWRVELWKQIAVLNMKEVRVRVLRWGVALGHREIGDDYHNARALRELVNKHFAPKKAKR